MKKLTLFLVLLAFSAMLFGDVTGVHMHRHEDLDVSFGDYELPDYVGSPFTIEQDPYEDVPTFYIVGGGEADDYRYILRLTDPLDDPELELLTEVPIYTGAHPDVPDDEVEMWGQWVYLTGLAVSEDYIYTGARTHLGGLEEGDGPDGNYVVRYTKDGEVDEVRINDTEAHQIRGLHYVEFDEDVTYYVDDEGGFVHEADLDEVDDYTEHQANNALVGSASRAMYGLNPEDIFWDPDAEGHYNLNFRPNFWTQTVRTSIRDMVYDYESGDMFMFATAPSDAVEELHGQWEQVYDEFPAFDTPGIVRQENYNPLVRPHDDVDVERGQGTATEQIASLDIHDDRDVDGQGSAAWGGIDLHITEQGERFLVANDYWNMTTYIFNVLYDENGEFVGASQVYVEEFPEFAEAFNPAFYEDEEGVIYLLLLNRGGVVQVYEMEVEPTFSSSWSLFK